MSAFVAVINIDGQPVQSDVLDPMIKRISYRGPDSQSVWTKEHVAFGHTLFCTARESQHEQQPLTIANVTVVGNVRLDDRASLVNRLKGFPFEVHLKMPDIELLLLSYLAYGESCVEYLRGDFSFVFWDNHKQNIFAARDQLGIHTLFFAHIGSTVIFSNEITAIRLHPAVTSVLDEHTVGDFLLFGTNLLTDKSPTIFAEIRRLPEGHKLTITPYNDPNIKPYWKLAIDQPLLRYKTEQEYIEHFNWLLDTAVKDRIRTKQISILMSGGLDSTSLAAVTQRLVRNGELDVELQAITNVYDRIHPDTEAAYAHMTGQRLNIPVNFFVCDAFGLKEPLPVFAEPSQSYRSGLYEIGGAFLSSFGRTALYGEPCDALFRDEPLIKRLSRLPLLEAISLYRWLWHFLERKPYLKLRSYLSTRGWNKKTIFPKYGYPNWLQPDFEKRLQLQQRWQQGWAHYNKEMHPLHNFTYISLTEFDWSTHSEPLKIPNFTHSQLVMPFADLRLISFILSLPPEPFFKNKYLLRQAMKDELPAAVLQRRKTPLGPSFYRNLLAQPEAKWVDTWQPAEGLSKYIRREAVQPVTQDGLDPGHIFVQLRALSFSNWLEQAISRFSEHVS